MSVLATVDDLRTLFLQQVDQAGGAGRWLKQHDLYDRYGGLPPSMAENGSLVALGEVVLALGYRQVVRYEKL